MKNYETGSLKQLILEYAQEFCGSNICSTNGRLDKRKIDRLSENIVTMLRSSDLGTASKAREILEKEYPVMKYYAIVHDAMKNAKIYLSFDQDGMYNAFIAKVPLRELNSYALNFIETKNGDEEG